MLDQKGDRAGTSVGVKLGVVEGEGMVRLTEGVPEDEAERDGEPLLVTVLLPVCDGVALEDGVCEGVTVMGGVALAVIVMLAVPLAVTELVVVPLPVADVAAGVCVLVMVAEALWVRLPDWLAVAVALREGEPLPVPVPVAEVGAALPVTVTVPLTVPDAVTLTLRETVTLAVGESVRVVEGLAEDCSCRATLAAVVFAVLFAAVDDELAVGAS
jgi:hypothetical protein